MKAFEIAIKNFPTIDKDAKIKDALSIMSKKEVDRLIVTRDKDELFGIITEFDILFKLSQRKVKKFQPYNTSVASATTTPVDIIYVDTYVKTAADMMLQRGYSSLPVLYEDKKLYGLVTKREIIKVLERYGSEYTDIPIREIMDIVRGEVELFNRLVQAENKMKASGFNTLIVTYEKKFVGIITALDIAKTIFTVKRIVPTQQWEYHLRKTLVIDAVNKNVEILNPDSPLKDAVSILAKGRQKLVPILNNDEIVGVVSRRHIMRYMINNNLF